MKITVAGLGYVGISNAITLAQHNEVVGVDISESRVDMINRRVSPLVDKEIEEYLATKELNLRATTDINDATKFTRYNENNKTKSVTIDGKTQYPWAGTFQTASDLCLTEIYPGDYVANDENGKDIKRQYNRKDGHAMLKMLKCGANRDVRGRIIKSQAWNADVDYGHKGGFGSYTWTTETTTVTIPSNTNLSAVEDSTVSKTKW